MDTLPPSNRPSESFAGRLTSIDALRGFDMFWIIGGGRVIRAFSDIWPNEFTLLLDRQFEHVRWEGFHFEDLIYPLFLLLIGVVLPFSLARRETNGESLGGLYWHFVKRSALLVLLGCIPDGLLSFNGWPRLDGVLTHIGLCYLPAALLVRHTGWRLRSALVGGYLLAYWLASWLVPVPGAGAGVFTEAGSLASYIDHQFISGKLWNEGPASVPSGVIIILVGSLAGEWLRSERTGAKKAAGLALAGALCVVVGLLWSSIFPMIKRVVWSSSYVTYACGWSLLLLALFYWVVDVKGYRRWSFFFVVIGVNAILIYFLQSVVNFRSIGRIFFEGIAYHSGAFGPIVQPLGILAIKWWLLYFCYRHKIYFKL